MANIVHQPAHSTVKMNRPLQQDVEEQPLEPLQLSKLLSSRDSTRPGGEKFPDSVSIQLASERAENKDGISEIITKLSEKEIKPALPNIISDNSSLQQLDVMSNRVATLEKPENLIAQQLSVLSRRVSTLEDKKGVEDNTAGQDSSEDVLAFRMLKTVPEVRYCNWQEFKNRLDSTEEEFVIEVLQVGDDFREQVRFEQLNRLSQGKRPPKNTLGQFQKVHKQVGGLTETVAERMERVRINSATVLHFLSETSGQIWSRRPHTFLKPFKILIHFHEKMEEHFRNLEENFGSSSEALAPDFHPHSNKSNGIQEDMSNNSQYNSGSLPAGTGLTESTNKAPLELSGKRNLDIGKSSPEPENGETRDEAGLEAIRNSDKAYQDMKCYVEFVRLRLLPLYRKFDNADSNNPPKVRYDELWYLFRYNELVYQRSDPKNEAASTPQQGSRGPRAGSTSPKIWRLFNILPYESRMPTFEDRMVQGSGSKIINDTVGNVEANNEDYRDYEMLMSCYYIDYDGDSYSAVEKAFFIQPYIGEKDIHKLPIYPLRFVKDRETICSRLKKRGRKFQEVISSRQQAMAYDGWTLIRDPAGDLVRENWDNPDLPPRIHFPHHVDSDVIIDTHEAFQNHPWWKPGFRTYVKDSFAPETRFDVFPIIRWVDNTRTQIVDKTTEAVVFKDNIDRLEWNTFAEKDRFILDPYEGEDDLERTKQVLSEEDLLLLPERVFAFSFRDRKFFNADVLCLNSIPLSEDPFESLEINKQHKKMILANVHEHLERKRIQQLETSTKISFNQDFIRGKGRGLVILLHGAPGVGKTATAEAVAYAQKRPLFPITCGDLGTTPDVIESKLSQIFRLADLWDCVLLLDEAEVFLSQRRKNDDNIKRNAMVSIFLRTLEYYPGVLFLTTNRPGALDDAVKSRVHISLMYPSLGHEETLALFQTNIARLRKIEAERARATGGEAMKIKESELLAFATDHFHGNPNTRWNGRQIRNAFQIAASLAHYKKLQVDNPNDTYIGREQFQDVATMTIDYDLYRRDMFGKEEDELAATREERRKQSFEESRRMGDRQSPGQSQHRAPPIATRRSPVAHSRHWAATASSPGYQGAAQTLRSPPSTPLIRQKLTPSSYGTPRSYEETERVHGRTAGSGFGVDEDEGLYSRSEEQPEFNYEQSSESVEGRSPNWRSQY